MHIVQLESAMATKAEVKWPMVTLIRPLDAELVFDDRPYELGETIDLMVELNARGDVDVRVGRVDLVCEMRWTEIFNLMVPVHRQMPGVRGSISGSIPKVPKRVTEERRENYVHSSVVFPRDSRLS